MKALLASLIFVSLWVMPATLASAVIAGLVTVLNLFGGWPWFVWLLLSPTFYVCWLISFLSFCALSIGRMGKRHPKPRYFSTPGSGSALPYREGQKLMIVGLCSLRRGLISGLPLAGVLQLTSWGLKLLLRSYSPTVHIGKGVQIVGVVTDPDLVEIGDFTVIGANAGIAGHLWTTLPNGKRVYVSAPVKIGARVVVGAGAVVFCGCSIGDDAVIEPNSFLEPHTRVPAGEIWSGSPAVFRARRSRLPETRDMANSTN